MSSTAMATLQQKQSARPMADGSSNSATSAAMRTSWSSSAATSSCVEIQTALRLRPLRRKERDDAIVLEQRNNTTVAMHPLYIKHNPTTMAATTTSNHATASSSLIMSPSLTAMSHMGTNCSENTTKRCDATKTTLGSTTMSNADGSTSGISKTPPPPLMVGGGAGGPGSTPLSSIMVSPPASCAETPRDRSSMATAIQTAQDVAYEFNHVFRPEDSQAKVYWSMGNAAALQAMEPLKHINSNIKSSAQHDPRLEAHLPANTSNIFMTMGLPSSGKTFTLFGGDNNGNLLTSVVANNARVRMPEVVQASLETTHGANQGHVISNHRFKGAAPSDKDGMVFRVLDSLFRQAKHHVVADASSAKTSSNSNKSQCCFAVNICVVQVNEHVNHPNEGCQVVDILQLLEQQQQQSRLRAALPIRSEDENTSTPFIGTSLGRVSVEALQSKISYFSKSADCHRQQRPSPSPSQSSSSDHGATEVDKLSLESLHIRPCHSAEEARACIRSIARYHRKISSKRHVQSHLLMILQPVVFDSRSPGGGVATHAEGGRLVFLDMAPMIEDPAIGGGGWGRGIGSIHTSNNRFGNNRSKQRGWAGTRAKDTMLDGSDVHTAIMHCLRTLQHNAQLAHGKDHYLGTTASSTDEHIQEPKAGGTGDVSRRNSHRISRRHSLKKVPFRRHELTMLLQQIFATSKEQRHEVFVTVLLTMSPSYRDHAEKKALLADIESLQMSVVQPRRPLSRGNACTGMAPTKPRNEFGTSQALQTNVVKSVPNIKRDPSRNFHRSPGDAVAAAGSKRPKNSQWNESGPATSSSDADDEKSFIVGHGLHPPPVTVASKHVTVIKSDVGKKAPADNNNKACALPTRRGMANALSMSYSESTIEEDDRSALSSSSSSGVIPLPPPMAPCHSATGTPLYQRSASFTTSAMSSKASAPPMEDCDGDSELFPQSTPMRSVLSKDLNDCNRHQSTSNTNSGHLLTDALGWSGTHLIDAGHVGGRTGSIYPVPRIPFVTKSSNDNLPTTNGGGGGVPVNAALNSSQHHSLTYYNVTKTLNKVVHASTKKGWQVMEKIIPTSTSNLGGVVACEESGNTTNDGSVSVGARTTSVGGTADVDQMILQLAKMKDRIRELEHRNEILENENQKLQDEKQALVEEKKKITQTNHELETKHSSINNMPASIRNNGEEETTVGTRRNCTTTSSSTNSNDNDDDDDNSIFAACESQPRQEKDSLFDNPLFHRLAEMNRQYHQPSSSSNTPFQLNYVHTAHHHHHHQQQQPLSR